MLRKSTLIVAHVLVCLLLGGSVGFGLALAADPPAAPKSPRAKAAIKKYERAVERAKADYDRAVAKAAKELRSKGATHHGADRIVSAKKRAAAADDDVQ